MCPADLTSTKFFCELAFITPYISKVPFEVHILFMEEEWGEKKIAEIVGVIYNKLISSFSIYGTSDYWNIYLL